MDEVRLNQSPAKTPPKNERAQDIRLEALKAAVSGSQGGMNTQTVIDRALAFERYIIDGSKDAKTADRSWVSPGD